MAEPTIATSDRIQPKEGLRLWSVLVLLLLVVLTPVLLVQVASYYRQYRERRAEELRTDIEAAQAVGDSFEVYLRELRRDELAVARAFVQYPPAPRDRWSDILLRASIGDPALHSLTWADPSGRILASSTFSRIGQSLGDSLWISRVKTASEPVVTDLHRGANTFSVAVPVRDDAKQLRGIMVADIIPDALETRLALHLVGARTFSLVDNSGWLVYHYPPDKTAAQNRDWFRRYPNLTEALRTQTRQSGVAYDPYHQERHLFAIVPIPSLGWVVTVAHPEREVTSPIVLGLVQDGAILTLVALVAFLIAAAVARRVTVPVERLSDFTLAVGKGDFTPRVEAHGPRELQQLSRAFNQMAEGLQQREEEHYRLLELERERAHEARILEAIQEHTTTLLAYFDSNLRFRQANTAYCRYLGLPRAEVIGRHYSEVSESKEILDLITRARDLGKVLELHEFYRPATSLPYREGSYWDAAIVPVYDEQGKGEGVVVSATEVTQQVIAREQLLAAEREQSEVERARANMAEIVAAETNHRMTNNLSLVSSLLQLQLHREEEDSRVTMALKQAITRISALAAVHKQLYTKQPGKVELRAMLQQVAQAAASSLAAPDLDLSYDCAELYVPPKVGSVLAMIANEMVTNAIKHGAPNADGKRQVVLSLLRHNHHVMLRVWNSGPPLAADFNLEAQPGMGLRLIQDLAAAQLEGTLYLQSDEGGTRCEVMMEASALELSYPTPDDHEWQI